jgi:Protein ChrB, N-terminal
VTNETAVRTWLVVSVSTAGGAASLRVQVWRKLRSLGALYLQQSVCLLPATADVACDVRRLAARVRQGGGTARVLPMAFTDPAAEQAVIGELNAARDAEYAEVLERLPELHRELAHEQARGRATYAEVEESEADLHRFRAWLGKIEARDYFRAAGGDAARTAVAGAAAALAAFEDAALRAETSELASAAGGDQPRLRAVDGQ